MFRCSNAQLKCSSHKDSKRGLFCTVIPVCESNRDKGAKSIVFLLSHPELPKLYLMARVVCLHHRLTVDPIIHCETPSVTWGAAVGDWTHTEYSAALQHLLWQTTSNRRNVFLPTARQHIFHQLHFAPLPHITATPRAVWHKYECLLYLGTCSWKFKITHVPLEAASFLLLLCHQKKKSPRIEWRVNTEAICEARVNNWWRSHALVKK